MRWDSLAKRATRLLWRIPPRVLRGGLAGATVGVVVLAAHDISSSMPSLKEIRHPDAIWVCAALLAEIGALVAYALIVRSVLAVWQEHRAVPEDPRLDRPQQGVEGGGVAVRGTSCQVFHVVVGHAPPSPGRP